MKTALMGIVTIFTALYISYLVSSSAVAIDAATMQAQLWETRMQCPTCRGLKIRVTDEKTNALIKEYK